MSITPTQTLEGHAQNISAVTFHPELPIILTGSEDGTFRVWHANTYRFVAWLLDELSAVFDVLPIGTSISSFYLSLLQAGEYIELRPGARLVHRRTKGFQQRSFGL